MDNQMSLAAYLAYMTLRQRTMYITKRSCFMWESPCSRLGSLRSLRREAKSRLAEVQWLFSPQ